MGRTFCLWLIMDNSIDVILFDINNLIIEKEETIYLDKVFEDAILSFKKKQLGKNILKLED